MKVLSVSLTPSPVGLPYAHIYWCETCFGYETADSI